VVPKAAGVTQIDPPPQVDKQNFEHQLATAKPGSAPARAAAVATSPAAVTTSTAPPQPASPPPASPPPASPPTTAPASAPAVATADKPGTPSQAADPTAAPAAHVEPVTSSTAPWTPQARAPRDPSFPALMAELHMAGSLLTGGLSPVVGSGGVAVLMGPQSGDLDGAALGFAFDVDLEQALTHNARWYAISHRVRLEGQWLWQFDMGGSDVRLGLSGGIGVALATHTIDTATAHKDVVTFGPTARLMPQAGMGMGPGVLFVGLPLDVTVDVTGAVHRWAPLAAGGLVGYRLDL
jgi:hypothetical protein